MKGISLTGRFSDKLLYCINGNVLVSSMDSEDEVVLTIVLKETIERSYKRGKVIALAHDVYLPNIKKGSVIWHQYSSWTHKNMRVNEQDCLFMDQSTILAVELKDTKEGIEIKKGIIAAPVNDFLFVQEVSEEERKRIIYAADKSILWVDHKEKQYLKISKVLDVSDALFNDKYKKTDIQVGDFVFHNAANGFYLHDIKCLDYSQVEMIWRDEQ